MKVLSLKLQNRLLELELIDNIRAKGKQMNFLSFSFDFQNALNTFQ
jgi:hypothetical protein